MPADRINDMSKIQSPVPLVFVNGKINERQIVRHIECIAAKKITRIVVCPGQGLECEYPSQEWFGIFERYLQEAKKHNIKLWIYNTNNPPVKSAAFDIMKANLSLQSKYLRCEVTPIQEVKADALDESICTAAANVVEGSITKTKAIQSFDDIYRLTGDWQIFTFTKKYDSSNIDVLSKDAVIHFQKLTNEAYFKRFGEEFGRTIEAVFAAESSIGSAVVGYDDWSVPFTDDLFETYKQRYEGNPETMLPHLFFGGEQTKAFRAQFWKHIGDLFNERYHAALSAWCRERNVYYTGHNLHQEPLRCQIRFQGDMFGAMESMDIPGVDHSSKQTLGNYRNSIIGNKICASSAHISGKPRCATYSFANMDWDTDYVDLKKIVDWQYGLGINLLVPNTLFHTLAGESKSAPWLNLIYQSAYWQDFDYFSDYLRNLEKLLVGGKHRCRVAVFYPLSGLCAEYQTDRKSAEFEYIESFLNSLCLALMKNHVDYDFIDRSTLKHAKFEENRIWQAEESYEYLLIPVVEYLADEDVELVMKAAQARVPASMFFRSMEPHAQNRPSNSHQTLVPVRSEDMQNHIRLLARSINDDIELVGGAAEDILIYRREKNGRRIYFLVNRSAKHRKLSAVMMGGSEYAIYDPENNTFLPANTRKNGKKLVLQLGMHPYQSLFLVEDAVPIEIPSVGASTEIELTNFVVEVARNTASIFNFEYTEKDVKKRIDVRNPAPHSHSAANSATGARVYGADFTVECPADGISLILDSSYSQCKVELNGVLLELRPCVLEDGRELHQYLVDWSDLWVDCSDVLKQGTNKVRVHSQSELREPIRFVGSFGVKIEEVVKLVPLVDIDPFKMESVYPHYSGAVIYTANFVSCPGRHTLNLHGLSGTAQVCVNGHSVGRRLWAPYEFELSAGIVTGANKLEIIVRNNLANLIKGEKRAFGLRRMPLLVSYAENCA